MSFVRFLLRTFLVLLVLVVIAYPIGWFYAASQVKERLNAMQQKTFRGGLNFQFDEVDVSGFPLSFKVGVTNLSGQSEQQGFYWQAPSSIGASHSIFAPLTLRLNLSGEHLISGLGQNADLPPFTLDLDAPLISASMGLNQQIKHINIDIPSAILNTDGLGDSGLTAFKFDLGPASGGKSNFEGSLAEFLPPEPIASFTKLSATSFTGYIDGGLPKSHKKRHIASWQQAGGLVHIQSLKADLLPLQIDGVGTIGLSDRLQPNVDIKTYAQGFDAMLEKAVEFGYVPEKRLSLLQLGSAMFKRPARSGVGNEMVLPLRIIDGEVTFGPFNLVTLPPVNWRD